MRIAKSAFPQLLLSVVLSVALVCQSAVFSMQARADDPVPTAPRSKKSRYKRSRLTRDETENTADHRTMLLTTGEDRAVDMDFDVNGGGHGIEYGNPTVVMATLVKIGDKRQLVFKPLKAGETTVTVRDADGTLRVIFNIRVTGSNLLRIAGEIRALLRDIEGIEIRIVGPKVVIDGEVLVPADYGRLFAVTTDKAYVDYIMNLAMLSPLAMQVLAKRMQDDINTFAPNVRCRVVNGLIFLEGQVDSRDQADRAMKIATLYLPEIRPASLLDKDQTAQHVQGRSLVQQFLVINPAPPKKKSNSCASRFILWNWTRITKRYLDSNGSQVSPPTPRSRSVKGRAVARVPRALRLARRFRACSRIWRRFRTRATPES